MFIILCRLCGCAEERISHFPRCKKLAPIWSKLLALFHIKSDTLSTQELDALILLGAAPGTLPLEQAYSDLHLVVWKFILIDFTAVDLRNHRFDPEGTWKRAVTRYLSKANSLTFKMRYPLAQAEASNARVNLSRPNRYLSPLGVIDQSGVITWRDDFRCHICSGSSQPVPNPTGIAPQSAARSRPPQS